MLNVGFTTNRVLIINAILQGDWPQTWKSQVTQVREFISCVLFFLVSPTAFTQDQHAGKQVDEHVCQPCWPAR